MSTGLIIGGMVLTGTCIAVLLGAAVRYWDTGDPGYASAAALSGVGAGVGALITIVGVAS